MEFKVGETYHILLSDIKPYKIHICGIIDENQVVFKYFGRHKQWWHYEVKRDTRLKFDIENAKRWRDK
jgi:hypothetical protein